MKRMLSFLVALALVLAPATALAEGNAHEEMGKTLPLWSCLPFALLLLSIAVVPLVKEHWWESNKHKGIVAAACGLLPGLYFLVQAPSILLHTGIEYFSFLSLLFALFVISGGIFISGDIKATPKVNTLFLLIGAVLANVIGTTGAAMLLIRPVLRTNSERKNTRHIPVFFIFAVANVGGSLLPIGDPPLFLGFLKGVPFFWTLQLFPMWATAVGLILAVFYIWDSVAYAGEQKKALELDAAQIEPIRLHGKRNIPLLIGVVVAVAALPSIHLPAEHWYAYVPWREIVMLGLAGISLKLTPLKEKAPIEKSAVQLQEMAAVALSTGSPSLAPKANGNGVNPRVANKFSFHAITEVAVLFAGIFAAMIPALMILQARGGTLPVSEPWHFFFASGSLSSFLDNAPTYLTFLSLAQSKGYAGADAVVGVAPMLLKGISLGSVFMGAFTYIGNAPNFMVKSIAEGAGLRMPSFGGYLMWAICILGPIFVIINLVFLGFHP